MQLWGGHEPTINRVGDTYFDQTELSGHRTRIDDLQLFADLGVRALRYPVLWEAVCPSGAGVPNWEWTDQRLHRLRQLGIRPIAGLIHHGSGPRHTHLLDEGFAPGLAAHAEAAAKRYPWIVDWIPVNEPLTTARFSAQYGLWHPHAHDEASFWRALLNQIDAVRGAMRAIRSVNPHARLIQTEDLGRTYATSRLADQATFDNARRWMTWDLLCGRVGPGHYFWERLSAMGLGDRLRAILEDPCPPDVIGVNHYLTSDRFLDHRTERYPSATHGGNGHLAYADVEAVRVIAPAPAMIGGALAEAWERYHLPLAITEAHNGCTREEQMRWLREAWSAALAARADGATVEAVAAWALLGSHNWRTLLRFDDGSYEPGAYDVRSPVPRPTAVGRLLRELADTGTTNNPLAWGDGWWRRDIRLEHPRSRPKRKGFPSRRPSRAKPLASPPLLITGATGTLGRAIARACEVRGLTHVVTDRARLDLEDGSSIAACLAEHSPWAVVNAAGYVRVDDAEAEAEDCMIANADGALNLARACRDRDIPIVSFSSDLVFDGLADRALVESDATSPVCAYGRSKAALELGLRGIDGDALTIRTSAFFSALDQHNFAMHVVKTLAAGERLSVANDLVVSPTYVPDLVDGVLDLLIDGERGIWHIANAGAITWSDFAYAIAEACDLDGGPIRPLPWQSLGLAAPRPTYVALTSERGRFMPSLSDAIERFAADEKRLREQNAAGAARVERPRRARRSGTIPVTAGLAARGVAALEVTSPCP